MDQATKLLTDVQQRHADLITLTKTLTALSQLFSHLATLVQQQDTSVQIIAQASEETHVRIYI